MAIITFKPKQVTKQLVSVLQDRPQYVVINRFGVGDGSAHKTLESIGSTYGITRERVRQIENFALNTIRKSDTYLKSQPVFNELRDVVDGLGGIVSEEDLLNHLTKDPVLQNHIHLLLVLGDDFVKEKENREFKHRWYVDTDTSKKVQSGLNDLSKNLSKDDLIPESDMIALFAKSVSDINEQYKNEEIIKRWLSLSKKIGRNPLGDWGIATSSNINARGIRDYAFLVIRRHGSPMHFTEVASAIGEVFNKKAHVATCHNELIKDRRFVLVGRGLYALKEWGYETGVVKDVIRQLLDKEGSMSKNQIIDKVLKERYVKENTIMVNLQDSKFFARDKDGNYRLA